MGGGLERHYLSIEPCIIAETYLEELSHDLIDYKLFCFNGVPNHFCVCRGRDEQHHVVLSTYSLDWKDLDYCKTEDTIRIPAPQNLLKMIAIAKEIAQDFICVRVDFYEVNGQLYIGELTFTPQQNTMYWYNEQAHILLGKQLKLPID